ncbi:MAG: beta-N-acetylhexosaminidase [Oscillibacter sp.]|nr:beta-N-acetylhexosaminidase [Oscillibacter sp.]
MMKSIYLKKLAVCALVWGAVACTGKKVETGSLRVIPLPQEVEEVADAAPFVIKPSTQVCYPAGNEKLERTARFLASYIKEASGTEVKVSTSTKGKNRIVLEVDKNIAHPEGYELTVDAGKVTLKGATEAAVFYGIQTIYKALPLTQGQALASLPAGTVKDYPRFGYRGFLVDVGRHFFSVDYLKEIIDMLALHNINYFHWHLTEDQGWRIEIKKYPRLTEVGSYRKETITAPGSKEYDGVPVSGFYTQEEAKEIVRYAAERFITVIPEIDMPGHMLAALASYPELGCTGGPYEVATRFGVLEDVLCGGNPKTLQFAKDVLEEIMDIFPSEYIHIGGDECPKVRWKACRKCQAKIRELGLKTTPGHTKEDQLQTYFMGEVEKVINACGRKMLGWDEILEGHPTATSTVMAWTSVNAGIKSAQLNHKTIITPIMYLYLSNPRNNRLTGVNSVGRVYNFEPVADTLTEQERRNIIGAQGCIWTEWTKDSVKMEWQMMPRISALCEIQWTEPEKKDLDDFLKRLRHQLDIYTLRGYHYKQDIEEAYQKAE